MVTKTMKKARLFPWHSNQISMETQRSVTFSHEVVSPIASISIAADISSDQTEVQRLLCPIPIGSETDGKVDFHSSDRLYSSFKITQTSSLWDISYL